MYTIFPLTTTEIDNLELFRIDNLSQFIYGKDIYQQKGTIWYRVRIDKYGLTIDLLNGNYYSKLEKISDLLPCPFCGNNPKNKVTYNNLIDGLVYISCHTCNFEMTEGFTQPSYRPKSNTERTAHITINNIWNTRQ